MSDVTSELDRLRGYFVGRMSEEEKIALEDRLAREPALASELEQALELREGLRQLRSEGYFEPPAARQQASRRVNVPLWVSAAAAAVLVAVGLGLWWQVPREHASVLIASAAMRTSAAASPVVAHFTFISMRGATRPSLTLPPRGLIELRAAPETLTAASYRIALIRDQGRASRTLGMVTGVTPAPDGYLHCYADSSLLKPGSYLLRVEPEGAARGVEVFALALRSGSPTP